MRVRITWMNTMIKVYSDGNVVEGCNIALRSRLYVSGWNLSRYLKAVRSGNVHGTVLIYFRNNTPIGVCLVITGRTWLNIQFFVRKNERRTGVATALFKEAYALFGNRKYYHSDGIDGSEYFFKTIFKSINL